jgi:hypothetical protein
MTNAFEYGDALLPDYGSDEVKADDESTPSPTAASQIGSNTPYLNLAT